MTLSPKALAIGVIAVQLLVGCSARADSASSASYVDFIQHGDIQFVAAQPALGRALTDADLGPVIFRIQQTLSKNGRGGGLPHDGDAAFIAAGDPVFAVIGYAPSFRLAARHDGQLVRYEVDSNRSAKRGSDLLDLDGKVASISLLSEKDGRTILGRITDPTRVRDLTRLVLTAPVDQSQSAGGTPSGFRAFVGFELIDGTVSARTYLSDPGMLARGIQVGGDFRTALAELQAHAPTPTPVPAVVNLTRRYDLGHATRITVKGLPGPFVQDAALVPRFAAALDVELPATAAASVPREYTVVIFEFVDHYVSLAYDRTNNNLTVVAPPGEGFSVRAPPAFDQLVAAAR